jgi:hypothetical protein
MLCSGDKVPQANGPATTGRMCAEAVMSCDDESFRATAHRDFPPRFAESIAAAVYDTTGCVANLGSIARGTGKT